MILTGVIFLGHPLGQGYDLAYIRSLAIIIR